MDTFEHAMFLAKHGRFEDGKEGLLRGSAKQRLYDIRS